MAPDDLEALSDDALAALRLAVEAEWWRRVLAVRGGAGQAQGVSLDAATCVDVEQAAETLGCTVDWLRHHPELPFVVRLGPGTVRYAVAGMARYVEAGGSLPAKRLGGMNGHAETQEARKRRGQKHVHAAG